MTSPKPESKDKYAKKPRVLNERLKRRAAEKARKTAQHRRNARHG